MRRQSEHFGDYRAAAAALAARGLLYPVLLLAPEIADAVAAKRGASRPALAARSGRRSALSRDLPRLPRARVGAGIRPAAAQRWRLDMARRALRAPGPHALPRSVERHDTERVARQPAALGRRGGRPQGDPDELSSLRRRRRRAPGRHACGARGRPRSRHRPSRAPAGAPRPADAALSPPCPDPGSRMATSCRRACDRNPSPNPARGVTAAQIRERLGFP